MMIKEDIWLDMVRMCAKFVMLQSIEESWCKFLILIISVHVVYKESSHTLQRRPTLLIISQETPRYSQQLGSIR